MLIALSMRDANDWSRYSQNVAEMGKVLLIDTCGEDASVALCLRDDVLASEVLPERGASAMVVATTRHLLAAQGWKLADLDGVGVINGPGSFTGVRAGVAAAKGLCEAAGLRLAAVSRLAVLCEASQLRAGLAVLRAGRGDFYVRNLASGREWITSVEEFLTNTNNSSVIVSELSVAETLRDLNPRVYKLRVGDSLSLVFQVLRDGVADVALLDANYVRSESEIYRKAGATR